MEAGKQEKEHLGRKVQRKREDKKKPRKAWGKKLRQGEKISGEKLQEAGIRK